MEVVSIFLKSDNDSYLLQLRDDTPSIVFPGCWGLFGGTLEEDESPHDAIVRELQEEIDYIPDEIFEFRKYQQQDRLINIYYGKVTLPITELKLNEGMDLDFFTVKEILKGKLFSKKMDSHFPIPSDLQGYFKDFLQWTK